jgi:hypothetical protein
MPAFIGTRRRFLLGLGATLAAPAIVRASSLMKIVAPSEAATAVEAMVEGRVPVPGKTLLSTAQITREAVRLFMESNELFRRADTALALDMAFYRAVPDASVALN